MTNEKIAVYPGSFDPFTYGHLDVALRARKLFDKVIILVANNSSKSNYFFTAEERVEVIRKVVKKYDGIEVTSTSGAVVDAARSLNAMAMIRGLRAFTDFEAEYSLHAIYEYMDPDLETVYLMAKRNETFVSSTSIREMFYYKKNISALVPPEVEKAMIEKRDRK